MQHRKLILPTECYHKTSKMSYHKECPERAQICEKQCPRKPHPHQNQHQVIEVEDLSINVRCQLDRGITSVQNHLTKLQELYEKRMKELKEQWEKAKEQILDVGGVSGDVVMLMNFVDSYKWHALSCSHVYTLLNHRIPSKLQIQAQCQKIVQGFWKKTQPFNKPLREEVVIMVRDQLMQRIGNQMGTQHNQEINVINGLQRSLETEMGRIEKEKEGRGRGRGRGKKEGKSAFKRENKKQGKDTVNGNENVKSKQGQGQNPTQQIPPPSLPTPSSQTNINNLVNFIQTIKAYIHEKKVKLDNLTQPIQQNPQNLQQSSTEHLQPYLATTPSQNKTVLVVQSSPEESSPISKHQQNPMDDEFGLQDLEAIEQEIIQYQEIKKENKWENQNFYIKHYHKQDQQHIEH